MPSRPASSTRRPRVAAMIGLCATTLLGSPAYAQSDTGAVTLTIPAEGAYDFHNATGASSAQRLRDAPVPDPSTIPKAGNSIHDANTGADTTAFGTAYSYPNPLNDTTSGEGTVANSASRSANVQQRSGAGMVIFEWGYPPIPMAKVPGDDLTAAPPPVALIQFAVQADDQSVLDSRSLWIVERAIQAYGRAGLTEITIEHPLDQPHCCARYPDLIRAELIRNGLGPGQQNMLPGHRIRLVLAAMPASR